MGRRASLVALALVVAAVVAGSAQSVEPLSAYLGTWTVVHDPITAAPYDTGDHRITITTTSEAVALPVMKAAASLQGTHFCGASPQAPDAHPGAKWFKLTYTWSGGGALYTCATQPGGISFVEGTIRLDLTAFPMVVGLKGPVLLGTWYGKFGPGAPTHPIKLTKGGAPAGGGGGAAPAGAAKTVTEPAPGESVVFSSPKPLPADCTRATQAAGAASNCNPTATVTSSSGTLAGTTVVGEGETSAATEIGNLVASCWLVGPQTIPFKDAGLREALADSKDQAKFNSFGPEEALGVCLFLIKHYELDIERRPSSAGAGCRTARLAIGFKSGKVASVKLTAPAAGSVRYTCNRTGGTLKIGVSSRAKTGLRGAIGPRLDLGVVRSSKAPKRAAKLTFTFS